MRRPVTHDEAGVTDRSPTAAAESHFPLYRDSEVVTGPGTVTPAVSHEAGQVVLSLFPGVGLFDLGFEMEGFCVVRGPDLLWGGDVRTFHPPAGHFDGIIGGSPCQDFSRARRTAPTGEGVELLGHFIRIVLEASPEWFLLENVPQVPTVTIRGYEVQRIDLRGAEVGLAQRRLRHFQYGTRDRHVLILPRTRAVTATEATALASEGRRAGRRSWGAFCELQGLPSGFDLPGFTMAEKYRAVGNGVPVPMGRFLAAAIRDNRRQPGQSRLCACGCGRPVTRKAISAGPACRKRLERLRRGQGPGRSFAT